MTKNDKSDEGVTFLAPDEAPPSGPRRAYTRWDRVRADLSANPGVWAIVLEAKEGEPGYNSFHGKKVALSKNRPNVEAEVRTDNGVRRLYARVIGE